MDFFNFLRPTGQVPQQRELVTTTNPAAPENQTAKGADWTANVKTPTGKRSLLVPAWCRGVTLIMQTMGQMVVQWQKMNAQGGNYMEDRYNLGRKINYLLQVRPNPLMTASEMQEQIEFRKIYYGNAYVYIERNELGDPSALWLCTNGGYNPLADTYNLTYNRPGGVVIKMEAEARDVLHFKNVFLTDDMYMGIPMIDVAMKTLQISATADDQALQDVAKGGKHKVLIQEQKAPTIGTRGRANQENLRKMTDEFAADWMSKDVVMLDNVADAKIISQTSQQLQLLEQRGFEVGEIARILGIPRIMMMEEQGSNYKMPEHATQEFLLRTIQPRIRKHEDELNSKLLGIDDFGKRRIHVCELALRRLDAKGQADIDLIHLQTGWSPNEVRGQYDLPYIPDGDKHYISTNLIEVGAKKDDGGQGLASPDSDSANGNANKTANGNANGNTKGGEA